MSMVELFALTAHDDGRAAARARRLRQAVRRAHRADHGARAALPDAAGLRLGRDQGRRRARRHRPEVQPAARAATCSAPTGKPQQVVLTMPILPGLDGERKMSQVARQPHRGHRPPEEMYGKTLRDPGRRDAAVLRPAARGAQFPPIVGPRDAKHALARRSSRASTSGGAPRTRRQPLRAGLRRQGAARRHPRGGGPAGEVTCRPCSRRRSGRSRRPAAHRRRRSARPALRGPPAARRSGRGDPARRQAPLSRGSRSSMSRVKGRARIRRRILQGFRAKRRFSRGFAPEA